MEIAYLKFYNFLLKKPYFLQVIIFYLLCYVIAIVSTPLQLIAMKIAGNENAGPHDRGIFFMVIVGPIVETLVLQHWVFKILEKINWGKNKYLWIMVISSILFGLTHDYSLKYIIFAIFVCF